MERRETGAGWAHVQRAMRKHGAHQKAADQSFDKVHMNAMGDLL